MNTRRWRAEQQRLLELCASMFDWAKFRASKGAAKLHRLLDHDVCLPCFATIAEIYRQRWQIELFFKAIKQNLRLKTFIGTSANAVRTQIWTALIAMLLLKYLQFKSRIKWALSNLVAFLCWNLFT